MLPVVYLRKLVKPDAFVSVIGQPISAEDLALIEQFFEPGEKTFNEAQHPRDDHGRWTDGGGSVLDKPSSAFPLLFPTGRDTQEQFSDGKGGFTKERSALHAEIIAKVLAGTSRVENPVAIILGGGPGTGKSTLVDIEKMGKVNTVQINVDDIRAHLPELKEGKEAAFTHEEASHIGKKAMGFVVEGGRNVLLDGTGDSSLENLGGKVARVRAGGHKIVAEYVTVPTEVAVARAAARALRTGRIVPLTVLRETHAAVSRVFPEAIKQGLFDTARLWDASGPMGSKPTLVASAKGKVLVVHDQELWGSFLAKGKT